MQVELALDDWAIERDKESNTPKVVGKYILSAMGKKIAEQGFNKGYSGYSEIPFSGDLIKKIMAVESDIVREIKELVGG